MGILNKLGIKNKSELLISKQTNVEIVKANLLFNNKSYSECLKAYRKILEGFSDSVFDFPESYEIIKNMIQASYETREKENAYMYIALLALTKRAKLNTNEYIFTVAKISFDAKDYDYSRGLIKAAYYSTDGAYFCSPESKDMLRFVGIEDNRTFDDYSQEY